MVRGESIRVLEDYDLFENNVKGSVGVYLKKDLNTNKCLIFFPSFSEWGELKEKQFERLDPGAVTEENKEFVSRVSPLQCTGD